MAFMRTLLLLFLSLLVCRAEYAPLIKTFLASSGVYELKIDEKLVIDDSVIYKNELKIEWGNANEGMCRIFRSRLVSPEVQLTGTMGYQALPEAEKAKAVILGFTIYNKDSEKWESRVWWCYQGYAFEFNDETKFWNNLGKINEYVREDLKWLKEKEIALNLLLKKQADPLELKFVEGRVDDLILQGYTDWLPNYVEVAKGKKDKDGRFILVDVINQYLTDCRKDSQRKGAFLTMDLTKLSSMLDLLSLIERNLWIKERIDTKLAVDIISQINEEVRLFTRTKTTSNESLMYEFYNARVNERFEAKDPDLDLLLETKVAVSHATVTYDARTRADIFMRAYVKGIKEQYTFLHASPDEVQNLLLLFQEFENSEYNQWFLSTPIVEDVYEELDAIVENHKGRATPVEMVIYKDYIRRAKVSLDEYFTQAVMLDIMRAAALYRDDEVVEYVLILLDERDSPADMVVYGELLESDFIKDADTNRVGAFLAHMAKRKEKEVVWLAATLLEHKDPKVRSLAHNFLVKRVGSDQGATVKAWRDWYSKE